MSSSYLPGRGTGDFFDYGVEMFRPVEMPRRVYASLAESDFDEKGWNIRHFECVDADTFDRAPKGKLPIGYWESAPISVIEYVAAPGDISEMARADEGEVINLTLNDELRGNNIQHYFNLFTPGVLRSAEFKGFVNKRIKFAPPNDIFPSASQGQLEHVLLPTGAHNHCGAVYDVGQGNCNAILGGNHFTHHPILYFDMGGGVLNNAHTYPNALGSLCGFMHPPVVLSHWDWDHWS